MDQSTPTILQSRFQTQAQHLHFFQLTFEFSVKKDEIKAKRGRDSSRALLLGLKWQRRNRLTTQKRSSKTSRRR